MAGGMIGKLDKGERGLLKSLTSKRSYSKEDLDTILEGTIADVRQKVQAEAITLYSKKEDLIYFWLVDFAKHLYKGDRKKEEIFRKKKEILLNLPPLKIGQGIVGKVVESGKSSMIEDVSKDSRHYTEVSQDVDFQTKSMITVPLKTDEGVIGAIQALNKHVGDEAGFFDQKDLELVEKVAGYSAKIIEKVCDGIEPGEAEVAHYKALLLEIEYQDLSKLELKKDLLEMVGQNALRRYKILPLEKKGKDITVALVDPLDFVEIENFEGRTGLKVKKKVVATPSDIKKTIDRYYPQTDIRKALDEVKEKYGEEAAVKISVEEGLREDSSPIVKLVNQIIDSAYEKGASDIHMEPSEKDLGVRLRVDGILEKSFELPKHTHNALISRVKIMANLDIAEKRRPQDGRIAFKDVGGTYDIDLRINVFPMIFGENAVMRILDKKGALVPLEKMGFSEQNLATYHSIIKKPKGMILHVGPTGSGKTTALYSALNEINTIEVNIQTIEDPVEYTLKGINQAQINSKVGLNFATALRAFLRQDPDVIMVGEIRDKETAEIGIEAALTGHLMFSTMHTNDAAGTVTRFIDMGVEPFLISPALLGVVAQRLLRKLCECKEEYKPSEREVEILGEDYKDGPLYKAKGCDSCGGSGYKGRMGIHEVLVNNDKITDLINNRAPADKIGEAAIESGMVPLFRDGIRKAIKGYTTLDEVLRVSQA